MTPSERRAAVEELECLEFEWRRRQMYQQMVRIFREEFQKTPEGRRLLFCWELSAIEQEVRRRSTNREVSA